jgi:hypothetical protein
MENNIDSLSSIGRSYSEFTKECLDLSKSEAKKITPPLSKFWLIYSPHYMKIMFKSMYMPYYKPDPLILDNPVSGYALKKIEALSDTHLRVYAAFNKIEQVRLRQRYTFSGLNKLLLALAAVIGIFASLKKAFDFDILHTIVSLIHKIPEPIRGTGSGISPQPFVVIGIVLTLSIIITFIVILPRIRISQMLGQLIYIAMRARNIPIESPQEHIK